MNQTVRPDRVSRKPRRKGSEVGCPLEDSKMKEETQDGKDDGCTAKDFMQKTPFKDLPEAEQQDLLERVRQGSIRTNTDNFLLVEQ